MLLRILAFSCCCALALVACERPPAAAIGIAVLPFESLSPEKENAFFADGVYGVSTELARVANLKVISHNSVAKYVGARNAKEIGRALNVAYVLEGGVRREAGSIHLTDFETGKGTSGPKTLESPHLTIDEANGPTPKCVQYVCHEPLPWLISFSLSPIT